MQMTYNVTLSQNKNKELYKTGSGRGDACLRRISANNLLPLENARNFLKTTLLRCPTVFELPKKGLVLIYPSLHPSISLFHPSVHDYPRKMYTVL